MVCLSCGPLCLDMLGTACVLGPHKFKYVCVYLYRCMQLYHVCIDIFDRHTVESFLKRGGGD